MMASPFAITKLERTRKPQQDAFDNDSFLDHSYACPATLCSPHGRLGTDDYCFGISTVLHDTLSTILAQSVNIIFHKKAIHRF
jgi:hypothetical protein